jgi:hypothetical protein
MAALAIPKSSDSLSGEWLTAALQGYREIGARARIRVPALHHGAADPSNGDFVMLLEDLAPARVGDQLEGCTAQQARLAVTSIAKCHATCWQDPRLASLGWLPATNDPIHHFASRPTSNAGRRSCSSSATSSRRP